MLERNKWLMYPGLLFIVLQFLSSSTPLSNSNWTKAAAYAFAAQMLGGVAVIVAAVLKISVPTRDIALRFGYAAMSALAAALIVGSSSYVTGELNQYGFVGRLLQGLYVAIYTVLIFASAIAATKLSNPLVACWQSVRYILSKDGFQLYAVISGAGLMLLILLGLGIGVIAAVIVKFGVSRQLLCSTIPVIVIGMVAVMQVLVGLSIWSRFGREDEANREPATNEVN